MPATHDTVRPMTLFGIAITGVFASACLGAITNAVNGWVSPLYYVTILGWRGVAERWSAGTVWWACVAQGIFEGLLFGVLFSLIFTAGLGIITRAACDYRFAVRHLLGILAGALVFWGIGGLAAILLASISPQFYRRTFIGVPDDYNEMAGFAWVGGSIWGIELGGLVCVILGLIVAHSSWTARKKCGSGS